MEEPLSLYSTVIALVVVGIISICLFVVIVSLIYQGNETAAQLESISLIGVAPKPRPWTGYQNPIYFIHSPYTVSPLIS